MNYEDELAEAIRLSELTAQEEAEERRQIEEAQRRQAAEDVERMRLQEEMEAQAREWARIQEQEEKEDADLLAQALALSLAEPGSPPAPSPRAAPVEGPRVMEVVEEGGSVRARVHLGSVDAAAFIISPGGTRLAVYEARYGIRIVRGDVVGTRPEVNVVPAETGEDPDVQKAAVQIGAEALVAEALRFLQDPASARAGRGIHHIFIDASNICVGAQIVPNPQGGTTRDKSVRVNAMHLRQILECDRMDIRERVVVGSSNQGAEDPQWAPWRGPNNEYTLRIEKRTRGVGEQGVDATVRDHMNNLANRRFGEANPHTIVLLTGDGNTTGVGPNGPSFPNAVQTALANGFNVEVWSWRACLSKVYTNMQAAYPGHLRIVYLDGFRHRITFRAVPRTRQPQTHKPQTGSGGGGASGGGGQATPPRPRSSSVGNVGSVGSAPAVPPPCPDEYECPLTLCLMDDPVTVTVSGITYEREAIMQVISSGDGLEPCTRAPFTARDLIPNRAIKGLIDKYKADQAAEAAQPPPPPSAVAGQTSVGTRTITVPPTNPQSGRDVLYELHYHSVVVRDSEGRDWSWRDVSARYERANGARYTRVLRLPCDVTGQPYRLSRFREERIRPRGHDVFVREPEPHEPMRDPQDPTQFIRNSYQYPFARNGPVQSTGAQGRGA